MSIARRQPLFTIEKIYTEDGLGLEGLIAEPKNQRKKTAVLFVHGLGGSYGNAARNTELAKACVKRGMAYAIFNTRGHDTVSSFRKKLGGKGKRYKTVYGGTAFEKFKECIFDIRAMIGFLEKLGYRKIVLLGHSTGANKALYYLYKTNDKRVRGLCLASPISDVVVEKKNLGNKFEAVLKKVKLIAKKHPDALLSASITSRIMTARRYLSLHTPGSAEDVFPYAYHGRGFAELKSVRVPVSVIIGDKDAHLDRSAKELVAKFSKNVPKAKSFSGLIVKGGEHSFYGREKEFAEVVGKWVKSLYGI